MVTTNNAEAGTCTSRVSNGSSTAHSPTTVSETLAMIRTQDRYIAHAEIERLFIDLPRGEGRPWGYELVPADDCFVALVRAWGDGQELLTNAVPGITWQQRTIRAGARAMALVSPKKTRNFTRFRVQPGFAIETAHKVLKSCEPTNVEVGEIQTHAVNKPHNAFSFPACVATFQIGVSEEQAAPLLTKGRAGLSAFGVGMIVDEDCPLFEVMQAAYGNA